MSGPYWDFFSWGACGVLCFFNHCSNRWCTTEPYQADALFLLASALLLQQGAGRDLGPRPSRVLTLWSQSWIPGMRLCMRTAWIAEWKNLFHLAVSADSPSWCMTIISVWWADNTTQSTESVNLRKRETCKELAAALQHQIRQIRVLKQPLNYTAVSHSDLFKHEEIQFFHVK